MDIKLLTDREATVAVRRLIEESDKYSAAVAWAGKNEIVDAMIEADSKLFKVVIGTHMYQTDPAVLRRFGPHKGARCLPPNGRLFHPKLYYFETPDKLAAIVGSHNLTGGAFGGRNIEASVYIQGTSKDKVFQDIKSFIDASWDRAERINEETFLFAYEVQYLANKEKLKDLNKFSHIKPPYTETRISPFHLTWQEFNNKVNNDDHHNLEGRLSVLECATELFRNYESFDSMSRLERKAIAGTYRNNEVGYVGLDWAWFGRMSGQGDFKNLVNESPELLSKALDRIPLDGEISKTNYDSFCQYFKIAFRHKTHKGGIATASRLLVMKRPDFFVGVNDANKRGICNAFGSAHTTLNLENYWERIIVPMHSTPWWLTPRPRIAHTARIWDTRAALLDSIYYEPK